MTRRCIETCRLLLLALSLVTITMSASFAQNETRSTSEAAQSRMPAVETVLAEKRSPARDRRLYDSAVALFDAIEADLEPDVTAARRVLAQAMQEAALGGMPEAWLDYGRCLWNGWGVPENRNEALAAYKKAAALGSDEAVMVTAYNLYWHFERYDEAHGYVQRGLKIDPQGEVHYIAGLMAYNGQGRPKDLKDSLRLHQEAARRGNADAIFELSVFAFNGIGSKDQAANFLRKAAELGQLRAMYNMGALHATGQLADIAKNPEEAAKWYRRAADKGHARAAANLGVMAIRGEGMPRDEDAAKAFFARAEELGFDVDQHLRELGVARP